MAAKDYMIVGGWQNAYLVKRTKSRTLMSKDRREITDDEIIGLFEFYLRKRCEELNNDEIVFTSTEGEKIFVAKLIDKQL